MDDFADFSPAPPAATQPGTDLQFDGEDAVNDFLSREAALRQQLGETDAIFGAGPAPTSASSEPSQPAFEPAVAQNEIFSSVSVDASPVVAKADLSSSGNNSNFSVKDAENSDAVKKWREKQAEVIAAKDKAAEKKRQETLAKARQEIDAFYAEYNQKKSKQIQRNKDLEQQTVKTREEQPKSQPFWDRVSSQIDFTGAKREAVKAAAANAANAQKAATTETQPKRDTARFKAMLLQLKNDSKAPGSEVVAK